MCVIGIVRGENTSKVNLIVTWQKHVLTWSQSTDLDPPLPLFWANNVQSLRAAVETEENPARQMAPRRSVLQVAAQSFTYTDNLNNSWSRKCGRRHKIEKTNPPQKVGFRLHFFTNSRVRKSSAPCCLFLDDSNTEIQSLSVELTKSVSSFDGKACLTYTSGTFRLQENAPQLLHTLGICFCADCHSCGKGSETNTEIENIYTWRRGSAVAAWTRNWTSRIDHLWQDTKQKTSSHALDHHTVISLSTFLTLSALNTYKWYKWKVKWAEITKWKIEIHL